MNSETHPIPLTSINRSGGTQTRVTVEAATVDEYAEALGAGAVFPPVIVFYDGEIYWLADGFHRAAAAEKIGATAIAAEVRQGTRRDAVLYSVGANAAHGLRRSNGDKRRAVETLLRDEEWRCWADREIARRAGVDHKTVGALRADLIRRGEIPQIEVKTVARLGTVFEIETETSYEATPALVAEVEAARQIALAYLAGRTRDDVKALLERGDNVDYPDGSALVVGEAILDSQKVTRKQIGVRLTTANGTGVYRFDAITLFDWAAERDALAGDETVCKALLNGLNHHRRVYIDSTLQRNLIRHGLLYLDNYSVLLTAEGWALLDAYVASRPLLAAIYAIWNAHKPQAHRIAEGADALSKLHEKQQATGKWIPQAAATWDSLSVWADGLVASDLIRRHTRTSAITGNPFPFYAMTADGCALLGVDALPDPAPLPDLPYNEAAACFVPDDAQFRFAVGDTVQHSSYPQRRLFVIARGVWPLVKCSTSREEKSNTWTPTYSEFDLELWVEPAPEVVTQAKANKAQADLDDRTADLLDSVLDLLVDVSRWGCADEAARITMLLETVKSVILETETGKRVAPDVEDERDILDADEDDDDFDDESAD